MLRLTLSYDRESAEISDAIDSLHTQRVLIEASFPQGLEAAFQSGAQYRSSHTSSVIEGNQLAFESALPFIAGDAVASAADEVQVQQLNEAYEHAYRVVTGVPFTFDEGLLKALHSVILKGAGDAAERTRGAYRNKAIGIRTPAGITYIGPPEDSIRDLMAGYVEDLNRWTAEEPGPIAAALAHFAFVSIHPFEDGNGRLARLIADLVLDLSGWSQRRTFSLSEAILKEQHAYYAVLDETQGSAFREQIDATAFVLFHIQRQQWASDLLARGVAETLQIIDAVKLQLEGTGAERIDFVGSERIARAIVYLTMVGPISSSRYAALCDCSQATATHDLRMLVDAGAVIREGGGRSTRYRINLRQR